MDFYEIRERSRKKGVLEVYPSFLVHKSEDLMIRGGDFYAVYDESTGLWSTDEYMVKDIVDRELFAYKENREKTTQDHVQVVSMREFESGSWSKFQSYIQKMPDTYHELDMELTFANTDVKKTSYVSKRLPYSIGKGSIDAYDELMSVLYDLPEREKLEWAIGSIIAGDSKHIQKFIVLYGEGGTGKSTVLSIIERLFSGYYRSFEAKALGQQNNQFATEMFRENPLVAIQHDGDLSYIEDNSKLNSIISHEEMLINEKFKSPYTSKINSFLFMATNRPVRITDSKSGIIRRLIDVHPTGKLVGPRKYNLLKRQIGFELGAIAQHCLDVYLSLGENYYMNYKPLSMMYQTDITFNFVEEYYHIFANDDGVSLKRAWEMYNRYCDESGFTTRLNKMKFKEELKAYFANVEDRKRIDDLNVRNYYSGFLKDKFVSKQLEEEEPIKTISFHATSSLLDSVLKDYPAQYATNSGVPLKVWDNVETTLKDLDTTKLHYVQIPENHIVIDFDLKDADGNKDALKNLEMASLYPPTYGEYSKSGGGVHLHYIYEGDPTLLKREIMEGVEIKVFTGKSSLRRKLSLCNELPIAHISTGLPLKENKKMINFTSLKNEQALRTLIQKNLRKEIHANTKPSVDFIHTALRDAYLSKDFTYDVSDMRPAILAFAMSSTNNKDYCVKLVSQMHFQSEESENKVQESDAPIAFFDVEVFPNLFIVVYKVVGQTEKVMINPSSTDIEKLMSYRLIGFNNRRYDNHILYASLLGYTNEELYYLSQKIIEGSRNALFLEAYNLSYTDIYDFSSKKQSLKKFEIELGVHHKELGLPWDEPVPEERWKEVAEYCKYDVLATEAVFNARKADFEARQILAELSGLSVNDTTQKHTARIIFGSDRKPQSQFEYTDLSETFDGYIFEAGESTYRNETVGEGGYVYAEPGMYEDVALLDITSMHPTSIVNLNLFGPYTDNFKQLLDARVAIKSGDIDAASKMFDGRLQPYLNDPSTFESLSYALKIAINIVYGLTAASFENAFRDPRNIDNIVAKRGALFMIDLKHAVQEKGYTVAHIKTDSIKIPNATPEIIEFVTEFGKKYGYSFEHEATYSKMCLVNQAVYIAYDEKKGEWKAVGAQFQHPYVFQKAILGQEPTIDSMAETKAVKSALYLDMNEDDPDDHNYIFVGKVGSFIPVAEGQGGGLLMREQDGAYHFATGAKGHRWLETEVIKNSPESFTLDYSYHDKLVKEALDTISQFGDVDSFLNV